MNGLKPDYWLVAFEGRTPANYRHQIPLRPRFRHVWAAAAFESGCRYVIAECQWAHVAMRLAMPAELAQEFERRAAAVLFVPAGEEACAVRSRLIPSCVTFTRHLIGCRAPAVTPWGLYRRLRDLPGVKRIT